MKGVIVKALSGFYYVDCNGTTYECKARGSFRKSGVSPLVGDRVEITASDSSNGVVEAVLPRKNVLVRPPVANIDKLFIVSAFSTPAPNTNIIDKLVAIAEYNGIEPIIVFNKSDMGDLCEFEKIYKSAGFKAYIISANNGDGMNALKSELKDCVSAFTGNSGVGKSSILNFLFESRQIAVGDVSQKLGRGRHTTRHTQLYALPFGGFVADTPGFSALENENSDYAFKEKLPELFREFSDYKHNCRFTSCTHTCESGCAVLQAVKSGKISPSRHNSYLEIFEEMKNLKPWESDKRKKR